MPIYLEQINTDYVLEDLRKKLYLVQFSNVLHVLIRICSVITVIHIIMDGNNPFVNRFYIINHLFIIT